MSIFKKIENYTYKKRLKFHDRFGSDESYLKCMFYHRLGYRLNLKNPTTFNEKLQWIKLNDHNPKYSEYADKYKVREHIKEVLGEEYLIPLIDVFDSPDQIDFDKLPDRFVLKCNHGAGYNIICRDKESLDIEGTKDKLNKWLSEDYWKIKREFHYKAIEKKIICETFMSETENIEDNKDLLDYKFFCINGDVYMIQVDFDRYKNHTRNIYDKDWNLLDVKISFENNEDKNLKKPEKLQEMIEIARKLSEGFKQVRIDLFVINNRIYFGEMTFFSGAGFSKYNPRSFELEMGKSLKLD